jgi:hypothetical protein
MNALRTAISLGAGLLLIACGGTTPDATGTVSSTLSAHAADAAAGHQGHGGIACKPGDAGPSPCARGDGGDDDGDADDNEDQGEAGQARGDAGHRGDDQADAGEQGTDEGGGGVRRSDAGRR